MVNVIYDINHYAPFMINLIHLQATTKDQTISTSTTVLVSTFGIYKPFISYYYQKYISYVENKERVKILEMI